VDIENRDTFLAALQGPTNLLLGAGFSTLARDKNGEVLPTGDRLAEELRARFGAKHGAKLNLSQLCTVIARTRSDELHEYLTQRFTVVDFDRRYRYLDERL
jgi:hypothetical protein